ncbi:MAG: hypothetical protein ACYCQJ_14925 [Nitrososphaerales archaeon]
MTGRAIYFETEEPELPYVKSGSAYTFECLRILEKDVKKRIKDLEDENARLKARN